MDRYLNKLALLISTGFYFGYLPTPGLVGALLGELSFVLTAHYSQYTRGLLALVMVPVAIFTSERAEKILGTKDPRYIVVDEVVGVLVATSFFRFSIPAFTLSFLLFLLFDRVKPWPASSLQNFRGGWGIVLDDIVAGLYTLFFVWAIQVVFM